MNDKANLRAIRGHMNYYDTTETGNKMLIDQLHSIKGLLEAFLKESQNNKAFSKESSVRRKKCPDFQKIAEVE